MGQKVSPHGLRVGVINDWDSKWYADKKGFADYLIEDNEIRAFIKKKLYAAGISKTVIERAAAGQVKVTVMSDKPGIIIGRSGEGINELKAALEKLTKKIVHVSIVEVRRSELDAQLTAESIAQALEKRISFRRAMKQAIGRTMKANAKGIKVLVAGRLGGAEIARSEKYSEGNVPLHTLRALIDYGFAEADTQYGKIGVKVWINHGERLEKGLLSAIPEEKRENRRDGRRGGGGRGRDGDRPRRDRNDRSGGGGRGRRDDGPAPARAVNPRKRLKPKYDPAEEARKAAEAAAANQAAAEADAANEAAAEATAEASADAAVDVPETTGGEE
ncbi:MAG: 30S ribosomal protein S3 [Clostridiales Family XIII bacterium]|jgi:small subunit ribosomal protein S3|nr:30S ribosomal protein S3 [Clostridiales Family XIII bacterium]